ncbi:hypothetical protein DPSP01_000969 [Paraphaeosphaeria sporulosa]|uniref:Zn(2)-C6 fungal-type domain-containing protein n=1 Tax=Paraphaeosphaeria sporulosa TaxID=1460663 RepID=A0A177C3G3_9PLEO|nr:uncharacterized protein CC84DRAFT_1167285 [Paraphaeosphaeria sporulosa]OAG02163.1 hypothetical protein CC84DRAFT_1167285 [Paraphaeosphaeria sporulosa]
MVYRGRPSTGCKTCRQRKIKCDERPEGCVKCADKGYQCPGYERIIDRLFQDESAAVERKAQKSKAKALIARDEREQAAKARRAVARMSDAIGTPLLCPLIDRGIAFFMMNYASGVDLPPISSAAYNQHLSTFGFHPIVATAMTALGLAGTANLFLDNGLKREATTWYLDALNMTNKALTKPSEAKSDHTLLATMLLSVFESTHNEFSFQGWLQHVQGSASLVRMRGLSQFQTPAGRRMYMQTVGLLAMKCMGMGIALPRFVHEMNKEVEKWEDGHDPGSRFFHTHIKVIDFRAEILNHKLTDLRQIVERASEIDKEATEMFSAVDSDWNYAVETCDEGTPGVFGTEYHIYPHLAAAQTWNWLRYIRIYIHDILRNALIAGFSSTPPVFVGRKYMELMVDSTETLYKMQSDIFASMPQYLHDTPKAPPTWSDSTHMCKPESVLSHRCLPSSPISPPSTYTFSPSPFPSPTGTAMGAMKWGPSTTPITPSGTPKTFISNFLEHQNASIIPEFRTPATPSEQLPIVRVSGGYSSLWALFIAGATPIASPESQAFVLSSLERVASEFGINQAKVFASALRTKIELERTGISKMAEEEMLHGWDAGWYAMLGDKQKFTLRNAALKGGEGGIAPIYMPRVGPHVDD